MLNLRIENQLTLQYSVMKKILVPTDFSSISENALQYALEIASAFSSEILLYHVYSFHHRIDYDRNYPEDEQPYVRNIEKKMSIEKSKFANTAAEKGVAIKTVVEESSVFYLFKNKVEKYDIDLIIMGTKGETGLEGVIFGSVAVTALENSRVPVLVVPPEHTTCKIEKVALATDLKDVSKEVIEVLEELIIQFSSELTVLSIIGKDGASLIHEKSELRFKGLKTLYKEIEISNTINETINQYVQELGYDLVCMIRKDKGFFESIFKRSVTKTQVYHTNIPFLVLPQD